MRKNRPFKEWYDDMRDNIERSLLLIVQRSSCADVIKDKMRKCKSFEQRLFFERDLEEAIKSKIIYKRIADRCRMILMNGINVHYARTISRGLNIDEAKVGSKRKDYLGSAFISRDIYISHIDSLFNKMDKEN